MFFNETKVWPVGGPEYAHWIDLGVGIHFKVSFLKSVEQKNSLDKNWNRPKSYKINIRICKVIENLPAPMYTQVFLFGSLLAP